MKKTIFFSLIFLLSVLTIASCKVERIDKNRGPIKTTTVNAKDFNGINISSSADVTYIPSNTYSVTVTAAEKDRQNLKIEVKDGVLQISQQEQWSSKKFIINNNHSKGVKITVKAPSLNTVNIIGSGSFTCKSTMKARQLVLSISGSGDIDVNNIEADLVSLGIVGSGDINAGLTNVSTSGASISGSGDIDMKLKDCGRVEAQISGSGDINLSGNAQSVDKNVSGSGEIHTDELKIRD